MQKEEAHIEVLFEEILVTFELVVHYTIYMYGALVSRISRRTVRNALQAHTPVPQRQLLWQRQARHYERTRVLIDQPGQIAKLISFHSLFSCLDVQIRTSPLAQIFERAAPDLGSQMYVNPSDSHPRVGKGRT